MNSNPFQQIKVCDLKNNDEESIELKCFLFFFFYLYECLIYMMGSSVRGG